jgi:hypothetical protein
MFAGTPQWYPLTGGTRHERGGYVKEFASDAVRSVVKAPPPYSEAQMNAAIAKLREGSTAFARLSLDQRKRLDESSQRPLVVSKSRCGLGVVRVQATMPSLCPCTGFFVRA